MAENARILVADDEEEMRDFQVAALRGAGYRTLTATSGQEALAVAAQERAEIILADAEMPGMDGVQLLRRLNAGEGNATVVVVTAHATQWALAALQAGAFDYLLKPFDGADEIVQTVARAMDRRRQLEREANLADSRREKGVVSTGNHEIDDKMGGGIPLGSLTLIDGHSHAGKSVLAQQMAWGSLHEGFCLSFFTTENTVKSLVKQMRSLSIDILDFLLLRRLRVYPMEVARSKGGDLHGLAEAIKGERARGSDIVLVDALTPFILSTQAADVVGFFEGCKWLCSDGMTVVNVIHSHAVSGELLVRITSLCDAHLSLRTEETGAKLIKVMEVAKVRGASKNTGNIVSFEIEPGLGMRIIPISKAQG